jgi:hypothetical protein
LSKTFHYRSLHLVVQAFAEGLAFDNNGGLVGFRLWQIPADRVLQMGIANLFQFTS